MHEYHSKVAAALRHAPGFENVHEDDCRLTRLGGLTNLAFLVEVRERNVIVRIPGEGTEAYIDRAVEAHNAKVAHAAGVSATVYYSDPASG